MAKNAPVIKVTVIVNGQSIVLDPENMKYNENTLGEFMNTEYGWVDYLGKQLEFAAKEVLLADIDLETIYSQKFLESKDLGNSDNYAKAWANSNVDVVAAKKYVADRKEVVGHLKAHLKAWRENHDNAQNRGHTLRAEMKMLNREFTDTNDNHFFEDKTCSAEDFMSGLVGIPKDD